MHLRQCVICGHVGCCDQGPNRHATAHFHATEHPIIRSLEPGENWRWCYVDEMLVQHVICFCGVLDPESGRLTYANAEHNPPFRQHWGEASALFATGMPLGLMPGMFYEEKETMLVPGDDILFYSDGLVEAHNPEREMLGSSRVRDLVAEHASGAQRLSTQVVEELGRFTGERWEQEDDITL